jgi:hypothetical protein
LTAAWEHSQRVLLSHLLPGIVLPDMRLPADSLFPGHTPAHFASLSGLPNALWWQTPARARNWL